MTYSGHGGNIAQVCARYRLNPDEIIDFSANINPLGYSPNLAERIWEELHTIRHYPDIDVSPLRRAIASYTLHREEEILVGNGSTEFIYLIPRAFRPRRGLVFEPTYSDYTRALQLTGAGVREILCKEDELFRCDLTHPGIYAETDETCLLYLCNPNNPTGYLTRREQILTLAKRLPSLYIIVDEAFMDFVDGAENFSVLPHAGLVRNIIVLRSMTKFHGFPGLRLGYMVAHPEVIERVEGFKEPWAVNTLAQLAGLVAIKDKSHMVKSREFVSAEKDFLYKRLKAIDGLEPLHPTVNFILVKITDGDLAAGELQESLIKMGVLIRDCANFKGLGEKYFRVAVRTREENLRLLSCLEQALKEIPGKLLSRNM